jgi:hypothetical protein
VAARRAQSVAPRALCGNDGRLFGHDAILGKGGPQVDFNNDDHLDVCQNIEVVLKQQYERNPDLTDTLCVFPLDAAKTAVKQRYGYAKNEKITEHLLAQGVIAWCVSIGEERVGKVNDLTLKEYLNQVDKIKRSVKRHSTDGQRAYYEFIKNYV